MDEFVKYILYFAVVVMAVSMITLYIYGIRKLLEMRNLKRRCICTVEAEVIDIIEIDQKVSRNGNRYIKLHSPVYRFFYENEKYEVIEKVKTDYCELYKGDKVELHIDPDDPKIFYCSQMNGRNGVGIALIVIGAVVTILAIDFVVSFILSAS